MVNNLPGHIATMMFVSASLRFGDDIFARQPLGRTADPTGE
jgi:hypothetical protein